MAFTTLKRVKDYAALGKDAMKLRRSQNTASDENCVKEIARRHVIQRLGKMRGLPQKMGQMLSYTTNDERQNEAADYSVLQQSTEPLPMEAIHPLLQQAWQVPPEDILSHIEERANAASLGQVHQAVAHDGRMLAIKVQYPDIRKQINADLKMLGWLSIPLGNLRRGFDLAGYRNVILKDLEEELDYRTEAANQSDFVCWAAGDPFLVVPGVIEELSTDKVLVSTWEDGDDLQTVMESWPEDAKKTLARRMLTFFLSGIFERGLMHADWHPGNFRFRQNCGNPQLVLYDFGSVYRPSTSHRLTLLRLIRATINHGESPWPLLLGLGFNREYLEPIAKKLPALCRVIFEPFCCEHPYDLSQWNMADRVADVLQNDRWNFRMAGPPELVFLLRSFHGIAFYLQKLATPIMWQRQINPLLDRFAHQLERLDVPALEPSDPSFDQLARYMKIRVTENHQTKAEITAYASGIDDLDSLLGDDLLSRVKAQGICLDKIVKDVRQRCYAPGPVFQLSDGDKQVDVWLE